MLKLCKLTRDTWRGSLMSCWSLQLWITIKFTHQVYFLAIFLVGNCSRLIMNDLDTSLINRAETAFERCGLVHWSYSNPISLFFDIQMAVLVFQSWKKKFATFLLTFCGRLIRKRALRTSVSRYNNFLDSDLSYKSSK